MAMDSGAQLRLQKLDSALRQLPVEYANKDRLRGDVQHVLRYVATLQPQTQTFQGQGLTATLFYLYGVLPIQYQGANYNIPVTVYFDPPYPRTGPRAFVTPTGNMAVAPNHPVVDAGGLYGGESLKAWNEASTLYEVINNMVVDFGKQPPVYATSAGAAAKAKPKAKAAQRASGNVWGGLSGLTTAVGGWLGGGGQGGGGGAGAATAANPKVEEEPKDLNGKLTKKIKERWPDVVGKMLDDVNSHPDQLQIMTAEEEQLDRDIETLREKIKGAEEHTKGLEEANADVSAYVAQKEGKEANPDDMADQLDADSRMVLDMLAEERALDEFLHGLDELLSNKKVGIDDFLRECRDVSRKKYLCIRQRQKSEAVVMAERGGAPPAPPGME